MLKTSWHIVAVCTLVFSILLASLPFPFSQAAAQASKTINLEIIVDQSGSMAAATDTGVLRIDAAKNVLNEVIAQIPEAEGVNVGFRVYGHRGNNQPEGQAESCVSSDLLVPMQGVNKASLTTQVNALVPVGWTPLGYALEQAGADFTQPASENVVNAIIMVTDGLETCGADPAAIAGTLKNSEAGITTHVIGFGTKPEELAILEAITQASGGQLLGSNNAGQLMSSLFTILEELEVVEETGTGADRYSPIALGRTAMVGEYEVTVLSAGAASQPTGNTGGYDFSAHISVTYQGDRYGQASQDLEFSAHGTTNIRYSLRDFQCPGSSAQASSQKLFKGGSEEFTICWTVSPDDVESLIMSASSTRSQSPSNSVWFALSHNVPAAAPSGKSGGTFEVQAMDIRFEPDTLTIPANVDVTLVIYNSGMLEHDFVIDAAGINSGAIAGGQSVDLTLNLPPGTYQYYCSVPGHKEAGMVGTLIVE
jgi:plastocyanin